MEEIEYEDQADKEATDMLLEKEFPQVPYATFQQCFGSRSVSMWIRIEMAPLDPEPDPYWEYRSGSGSGTVEMVSKKGEKSVILS